MNGFVWGSIRSLAENAASVAEDGEGDSDGNAPSFDRLSSSAPAAQDQGNPKDAIVAQQPWSDSDDDTPQNSAEDPSQTEDNASSKVPLQTTEEPSQTAEAPPQTAEELPQQHQQPPPTDDPLQQTEELRPTDESPRQTEEPRPTEELPQQSEEPIKDDQIADNNGKAGDSRPAFEENRAPRVASTSSSSIEDPSANISVQISRAVPEENTHPVHTPLPATLSTAGPKDGALEILEAKIKSLREEAQASRAREDQQRRNSEKTVHSMQNEVREMRKKLEETRKREEQLESVVESREHGSGQLKTVIHSMREALKASGEEVADLGAHVEELEDEREELQQKLSTLMEQHQLQTDEQADAEDRLLSEKSHLTANSQKLESELGQLRTANRELEDRLHGAESISGDLDMEKRQHAEMQQSAHQMRAELAAAKADLQVAEQELEQQQQSAENLDRVFHQFQASRDADLKSSTRQLRERVTELETMQTEAETATAAAVKAAVDEATKGDAEQHTSLQQKLEAVTKKLEEAEDAAARSNSDMRQAVTRLKDGAGNDLVDRQLVTKLIVTYVDQTLHDARQKDRETLALMSRILAFTEEEKKRVGLIKSGGGLLSWLGGAPEVQLEDTDGKSFEDLLGDFVDASADLNAPPSPIA
jgi:hypothetical protein